MKLIQRGTVIFEDKDFFNYTNIVDLYLKLTQF